MIRNEQLIKQYADEDRWAMAYRRGELTRKQLRRNLSVYHSGKALENHMVLSEDE